MPIYEYICKKCDRTNELLQKFNDLPPVCECGTTMTKIISTSTFHLKGSGWYVTDYKNKSDQSMTSNKDVTSTS